MQIRDMHIKRREFAYLHNEEIMIKSKPIYPNSEQIQKTLDRHLSQPVPPMEVVFPVCFGEKVEHWKYRLKLIDGKKYYFPEV